MKKSKFPNSFLASQSGYYLISFVFITALAGLIGMQMLLGKAKDVIVQSSRNKAYLDSQVVIDSFAQQLKTAYDLAVPTAESNLTPSRAPTVNAPYNVTYYSPDSSGNVQAVMIPVGFYIPGGANQICAHRIDGSSSNATPALAGVLNLNLDRPICIKLPNAFSTIVQQEGHPQSVQETAEIFYPTKSWSSLSFIASWFRGSEVQAQSATSFDPGVVAKAASMASNAVSGFDVSNANKAHLLMYAKNDCSATAKDRFCVAIVFCPKISGACDQKELVKQTYVFIQSPRTSLYD